MAAWNWVTPEGSKKGEVSRGVTLEEQFIEVPGREEFESGDRRQGQGHTTARQGRRMQALDKGGSAYQSGQGRSTTTDLGGGGEVGR